MIGRIGAMVRYLNLKSDQNGSAIATMDELDEDSIDAILIENENEKTHINIDLHGNGLVTEAIKKCKKRCERHEVGTAV